MSCPSPSRARPSWPSPGRKSADQSCTSGKATPLRRAAVWAMKLSAPSPPWVKTALPTTPASCCLSETGSSPPISRPATAAPAVPEASPTSATTSTALWHPLLHPPPPARLQGSRRDHRFGGGQCQLRPLPSHLRHRPDQTPGRRDPADPGCREGLGCTPSRSPRNAEPTSSSSNAPNLASRRRTASVLTTPSTWQKFRS